MAKANALPTNTPEAQDQGAGQELVFTFPRGLYGFRDLRRFVVLAVPGGGDVLKVLQSLEEPGVAFTLVAPDPFFPQYQPGPLTPEQSRELGLEQPDQAIWMVLASFPEGDFRRATVNLKAPLVFNPFQRLGSQVILDGDYPVRQPLFRAQEAETGADSQPQGQREHPDRR